jgi:hypothetical protein
VDGRESHTQKYLCSRTPARPRRTGGLPRGSTGGRLATVAAVDAQASVAADAGAPLQELTPVGVPAEDLCPEMRGKGRFKLRDLFGLQPPLLSPLFPLPEPPLRRITLCIFLSGSGFGPRLTSVAEKESRTAWLHLSSAGGGEAAAEAEERLQFFPTLPSWPPRKRSRKPEGSFFCLSFVISLVRIAMI